MSSYAVGRTVFMFSGQGSQYFHMGEALFERNRVFREWMLRLDEVARRECGRSVVEAIYCSADKAKPFNRTLLTHPAIVMVEYALAQTLMYAGVMPDMTLGASLGSFAAAAVAGCIDIENVLVAAIRQAAAFEARCVPGTLLAVFATPTLFAERILSDHSEFAGGGFASHFTVACTSERLPEIEAALRARNLECQRLPVSFAYHSRWIDEAQGPFQSFMDSLTLEPGQIPLMCCAQAAVLEELPNDFLWRAVRRRIRLQEAVVRLERTGPHRYIDAGPSGTLATSLKYLLASGSASSVHAILTPYGRDEHNLAALAVAAGQ